MAAPAAIRDTPPSPVPAAVSLFGGRLSPFVEKVARALEMKRIPFSLVEPASPADFKKWSPQTGKMPVLDVDGDRTFDSTLIVRRIDELVPDPPLFSPDPKVAARQRFLEDWSDESLYWYVMALRWTDVNFNASATQIVDTLPVPGLLKPLLRMYVGRQIGSQATAQGLVRMPLDVVLDELDRRFDELVVWLDDSPFFFADRPSVADLSVYGQLQALRSGPTPQGAALIDAKPALCAWEGRLVQATSPA